MTLQTTKNCTPSKTLLFNDRADKYIFNTIAYMQFPKMTNHTVSLFQWLWYQKQSASDYNGDLLKQWWQKGRADDVENNMHTSQQKSDKSDTTAGMGLVITTEPDCLPAEVLTVACLTEKRSADAKNNMHSTIL